MRKFKKPILAAGVGMSMLAAGAIQPAMAEVDLVSRARQSIWS